MGFHLVLAEGMSNTVMIEEKGLVQKMRLWTGTHLLQLVESGANKQQQVELESGANRKQAEVGSGADHWKEQVESLSVASWSQAEVETGANWLSMEEKTGDD